MYDLLCVSPNTPLDSRLARLKSSRKITWKHLVKYGKIDGQPKLIQYLFLYYFSCRLEAVASSITDPGSLLAVISQLRHEAVSVCLPNVLIPPTTDSGADHKAAADKRPQKVPPTTDPGADHKAAADKRPQKVPRGTKPVNQRVIQNASLNEYGPGLAIMRVSTETARECLALTFHSKGTNPDLIDSVLRENAYILSEVSPLLASLVSESLLILHSVPELCPPTD